MFLKVAPAHASILRRSPLSLASFLRPAVTVCLCVPWKAVFSQVTALFLTPVGPHFSFPVGAKSRASYLRPRSRQLLFDTIPRHSGVVGKSILLQLLSQQTVSISVYRRGPSLARECVPWARDGYLPAYCRVPCSYLIKLLRAVTEEPPWLSSCQQRVAQLGYSVARVIAVCRGTICPTVS